MEQTVKKKFGIRDIMTIAAMMVINFAIAMVISMVTLPFPAVYLYGSAGIDAFIGATFYLVAANRINKHGLLFAWATVYGLIQGVMGYMFLVPYFLIVALIGPNGTGKSTIGRILAGLLKEKSGEVVLFGKHCRPKGRLGKVWYIPQDLDSQLFGEDLLDELTTGAEVNPERKQAAEEILEALELTPFIKQHPSTLSGGQKQRLALGVALMHEAPIIVLDEPTSGLDGTNMRNVSRIIRKLAKMGRTIIVITHDAECALACCERAMRLENGYITDDFQIRGAELLLEKIGYDQKEG